MRAIQFMMIDYIKVKQQIYFMPLFIMIAFVLWGRGFSILMPFSYMIFVAIIFATSPFGACKRGDAGFLVLLPSTTTHRVLGRFLYGMSFVGFAVVCCGIFAAVCQMMGKKMEIWEAISCLFLLAFCMIIITLEFLILYLAGEHMASQLLGIVRVAPPMAAFFAIMYVMDDMEVSGQISMMHNPEGGLLRIGILAVAAAFAVWVVSVVICVKVTAKRDYV